MSLFQIPDYSQNVSGQVRVLLKIIGSGQVLGTRLTLYVVCHGRDSRIVHKSLAHRSLDLTSQDLKSQMS